MALPNKTKIPVGTVLAAKYRITREIGRGGMATVHEAENIDIGKRVAIKVLAQELTGSSIVVERFLREARAAAAIRSPFICDVYDSGKLSSGQPFLVLELLEGESLYERMTRQRQLDAPTTLSVISQVCRGLTKAHAASIVHRDLKPENIFLTRDEEGQLLAKILDFGLAKFYTPTTKDQTRLTREGAVFGTPAYMSPEQVRGQGAVDHRADLWALGCITYECFTGKTVWSTDQGVAMTFAQIASAPPPRPARYRPDLPVGFTEWFDRTLDRNIDRRFQTAKELAEALAASFGMERRETSEIRTSPIEARAEALAALAAAQNAPVAPPPQPYTPPPPSSRSGQAPAARGAPPPPPRQQPAQEVPADHFRPIDGSDEDGDPTRVLTKRPPGREVDGKLERFRRTPDGRIAKVVPQVAPNAPPVPASLRPPTSTPVPGIHRSAQAPPQIPTTPRPRGTTRPTSPDHDSEIDKNPFAKARRRRRLVLISALVLLTVGLVVLAISTSSPPTGPDGTDSGVSATNAPSGSATAQAPAGTAPAVTTPSVREASPPEWLTDVRDAQNALASGDTRTATAKLAQAATKSNQHPAAQGLMRHVAAALGNRGTCNLTGIARPRTYDLVDTNARRAAATRPSVVAAGSGAIAAWTDAHGGASHAYVARLDGSFAITGNALDLTPDGVDVRGVELLAWGDKLIALYTDAKATSPGSYARWLGSDGKPTGNAVRVGPPKSAQSAPVILGAPGRGLVVGWTDEGDRDSEDIFLQKLSMTTLEPDGAPSRATDLVPSGAPRALAQLPRGTVANDALRLVFELDRKPASFIELQTIAFGELGREMSSTGSNREGRAVGSLALVNVDKSIAHAPQIACSTELCFVVWHGESPPGAHGAAYELGSGRTLWRRKFSANAAYPAVAAGAGGAMTAWIEDGRLVVSQLGRAGFARTAKVGRAQATQPVVAVVAGAEKGLFLAAWLDLEATLPEPYVARVRCP